MHALKIITLGLGLLVLLNACQTLTPLRVEANRSVYHNLSGETGAVFVAAYQSEANNSLEFESFKRQIESHLLSNGFSTVSDESASDYVLLVSYGVDGGQEQTVSGSTPIYGQTGGGYTSHSGTVYGSGGGYGTYSGSSYSMPTYGIVGSSSYSYNLTVYTRNLAIDMLETNTLSNESPRKVFEGRIKSKGCSPHVAEVMPALLQAMFKDFPAANGSTELITIPIETSSCAGN